MNQISTFQREMIRSTSTFRWFGLHYFSIGDIFDKSKKTPTIKFTCYFIFLLFLVIALVLCGLILASWDQSSEVSLIDFFGIGLHIASVLMSYTVIILSYMSTNSQKEIFENCFEISSLFLYRLEERIDFQIFGRKFRSKLLRIWMCFVLITMLLAFLSIEKLIELFVFFIFMVASLVAIISSGILFLFYVDLLNFNLKYLNKSFKDLNSKDSTITLVQPKTREYLMCRKLAAIKMIHLRIWETSELIDKAIGKQILMYVLVMVLGSTIGFYSTFLDIMVQKDLLHVIVSVLANIFSVVTLLILIQSTHSVEKQVSFLWVKIILFSSFPFPNFR